MKPTLDKKNLDVARAITGRREELKRALFLELSAATRIYRSNLPPMPSSKVPLIDQELHQHFTQANRYYQTASWIPDPRFPYGRPLLKKLLYRMLGFYTTRQTHFNMILLKIAVSLHEKLDYVYNLNLRQKTEIRELLEAVDRLSAHVSVDVDHKLTTFEILQRKLMTKLKGDLESKVDALARPTPMPVNGESRERLRAAATPIALARDAAEPATGTSARSKSFNLFIDRWRAGAAGSVAGGGMDFPFFQKARHVLDIGCGRGIFLDWCRENDIRAHGIDFDADMVKDCAARRLLVERAEAVEYVSRLPENVLDGAHIGYVVEMMDSRALVELLKALHAKLQADAFLAIEAAHPSLENSRSVSGMPDDYSFRFVPPQTLEFLLDYCGFRNITVRSLFPTPADQQLQRLELAPDVTTSEEANVRLYNRNIDKLNKRLFSGQAYAVIGQK
ncbi:MAG: methyltransferase domain-containing protein [Acidobacteria bacterium]|nr:methyltransferase domain-containing protein [Acidobacteriota bacterium]MBI3655021.1 methyltransferase domain-containing protein [Acidobacteriota bacterium]